MALVQLEVLNQLERVTGRKITEMFEWIVASGVSGFLVLAMVYGEKGRGGVWFEGVANAFSLSLSPSQRRRACLTCDASISAFASVCFPGRLPRRGGRSWRIWPWRSLAREQG